MVRKEFIHIRRDPVLVGFVVGMPIVLLFLFGYALRLKVDNLAAAIWDDDKSFFSLAIKDRLWRDSGLVVEDVDSEAAIRDRLRDGRARLGLHIPKGLSVHIANQQQTTLTLFVDGSMPTLAQAAVYGTGVLTGEDASGDLTLDDPDHPAAALRKPPVALETVVLFNPDLRDSDFFLPATIGMDVMIVTLVLSLGLVKEKELATIEQLMVTPISRSALIAGKMIPYALIATADFVGVFALARFGFSLPLPASITSAAALGVLFVFATLAFGAAVATLAGNQMQGTFAMISFITPSILLSGMTYPIEVMPRWIQALAWSLPFTCFVDAMRAITLKGTSAFDHLADFGILTAFFVLMTAASLVRFRKQLA